MNQIAPWQQAINEAEPKFNEIATTHNLVNYAKEAEFAMQAISKNDYLMKIANKNPASLRNAVTNVAAIGLSLNPASKLAYLVPRGGEACLDISYQGLIKLATDSGSILWAKAELVYAEDDFEYRGPNEKPHHKANVFAADRGAFLGAYCIAKTADGEFLIEVMTASEIEGIKAKSKGADGTDSPWRNFPGEMRKKAVIKRASKTWPKTERRMDEAIRIIDQHEGLEENFISNGSAATAEEAPTQSLLITEEQHNVIHSMLTDNGIPVDKFMAWANQAMGVTTIGDIPADCYDKTIQRIQSAINAKAKAEAAA